MALRVHVEEPLLAQAVFDLAPDAARHVQVRRLQPGDALVLFDGSGGEWTAEVRSMGRSQVSVQVFHHVPVDRDPPGRVTLAVGMPANERMDWLVEKAGELGASRLVPLVSERSVLRLSGERAARRRAHWQGVAVAAAEQCGATTVMRIDEVQELHAWVLAQGSGAADGPRCALSLSDQATALPAWDRLRPACLLSGPEGGLSPAEEVAARAAGFVSATLGPRTLRAETAPLVALARWLA